MQSKVRAGRAGFTGLAALSFLSLSGLVLASQQERPQTQTPQPKVEDATRIGAQQTPQAITKALTDLREAVRRELEKNAFLQGKGVDMASLVITTGDQGHAIAGAPTSGGTLPGGGLGGDRNPPPDPNRAEPDLPGDPGRPGQALGQSEVVGVVMLVGNFRTRMDLKAQPAESSFRGDVNGGTFTVRRASATSPMVQIVDSNDVTVATVPLIGFQQLDRPNDPATQPSDMRGSGRADWARIYLSILHYFHPSMG